MLCHLISKSGAIRGRSVRLSLPPKGGGQSWCILHRMEKTNRPPIASLACVSHECPSYGQIGQSNLRVRKTYGLDQIRYTKDGFAGYAA